MGAPVTTSTGARVGASIEIGARVDGAIVDGDAVIMEPDGALGELVRKLLGLGDATTDDSRS